MSRTRIDWLIAFAVTALAQAELWAGDEPEKPLLAVVAVLFTVPLAWRRSRSLLALGLALLGLALLTAQGTDYFTTAQFVALLLSMYSVGAHAALRPGLAAVVLACAVALANTLSIEADEAGDYVFPPVFLVGAWLAGRALSSWRERAEELERLNRELESQRAQLARLAVADERARMARELHDVIAHSVNVAVIQAEAAEEVLSRRPEDARAPLQRIQRSGREALTEMRRLVDVLREDGGDRVAPPPRLDELGALVGSLKAAGLEVEIRVLGNRRALAPGVELSGYRIVQEALTNTLKHAGATSATVTVEYGDGELMLEIADDGTDRASAGGSGHGLLGMRERVGAYGGHLDAGPREQGGFVVRASLPLET